MDKSKLLSSEKADYPLREKIWLGAMHFGTKTSPRTSFDIIDCFVSRGFKVLDTANTYCHWVEGGNGGESEAVVGKWLRQSGKRDEVLVSSKMGSRYPGCPSGLRSVQIKEECEKSLRRLGVDRIDIYFAHKSDDKTPIEETLKAFNDLRSEGKIVEYALSNFRAWRLSKAIEVARSHGMRKPAAVQQWGTHLLPRNMVDLGSLVCRDKDSLEICDAEDILHISYSPLLRGAYFSGEIDLPVHLDDPDNRRVVDDLRRKEGSTRNIARAVLTSIMAESPRAGAVLGTSTVEQMETLLDAVSEQ